MATNSNIDWSNWYRDKFDNLNNGLYIVFRTVDNNPVDNNPVDNNPLYVLKHYEPTTGENKLNVHNPKTILQKDKSSEDYQNNLELGIGDNVNETGFVKKGEEYFGIFDLPNNDKYKNRDNIISKLDNESTINNFYQHGIYDWLILDAIMNSDNTEDEVKIIVGGFKGIEGK